MKRSETREKKRTAKRLSVKSKIALWLERLELGAWAEEQCAANDWESAHLLVDAAQSVWVDADRELLGRLLRNLVENAFKYGKPGGCVTVSVRRMAGEAWLLVQDDGIGIAPEEQEKIWKRFYQVDPSRGDGAGAGLGLAIAQQIAGLHGGYLTLESALGEGSTFCLHLPEKNQESFSTFM